MNIFKQYAGLRKENYILFIGRIVTNLGAMVWPVLTLILSQKLGFSATQIALITILSGVIMLPAGIIGGKLADKYNKKYVIIYCDLLSIVFFIICGFIPLSYVTIILMIIAATCQTLESPAYDALLADITETKDRERAYSMQYLGANIGLIASPTIAGILFQNYLWLSFIISGVAIGTSTLLIYLKVQDIAPVEEEGEMAELQKGRDGESLLSVLSDCKVVVLYMILMAFYSAAYQQYGYLMPLDIGKYHGETGAVIYGSVSSLNCIVVVIFTPIITGLFAKICQTKKYLIGTILLLLGYLVFLTMYGKVPAYYVAIVLFTFGEIFTTIVRGPYITDRIPSSHRGRINGFMGVVQSILQGICLYLCGWLYDHAGRVTAWSFVMGLLGISIVGGVFLIFIDRKVYKEMYRREE